MDTPKTILSLPIEVFAKILDYSFVPCENSEEFFLVCKDFNAAACLVFASRYKIKLEGNFEVSLVN
jgi:hypothetical protein